MAAKKSKQDKKPARRLHPTEKRRVATKAAQAAATVRKSPAAAAAAKPKRTRSAKLQNEVAAAKAEMLAPPPATQAPIDSGRVASPQPTDIVLINHDRLVVTKVCPTQRQAEYWAELLCKGNVTRLIGMRKAELCTYSAMELGWLFTNSGGHFFRWDSYQEGLNATHALIRNLPVDDTPVAVLAERLGRELPPTVPIKQFEGSTAGHQFHMDAKGVSVVETPPHGVAEVPASRPPPPPPAPGEVAATRAEAGLPAEPGAAGASQPRKGRGRAAPSASEAHSPSQKAAKAAKRPPAAPGEFVPSPRGQKLWDKLDAMRKAGKVPTKDQAVAIGTAGDIGLSSSSAGVSYGRWCKQRGV